MLERNPRKIPKSPLENSELAIGISKKMHVKGFCTGENNQQNGKREVLPAFFSQKKNTDFLIHIPILTLCPMLLFTIG